MSGSTPFLVDTAGRKFPLVGPTTTLGRSRSCDIFIPDRRTSRRHAEARWDGQTSTLCDLSSTNGTFVNGRLIESSTTLHDGDQISMGNAIFTFRDPEATIREPDFPLLVVDQTEGPTGATPDVWVNRKPIHLSPKERALFDLLYRNSDRVCSRRQIADAVWPEYEAEVFDYQIESLVKRLREQIEPDPRSPVLILTRRGRGYLLVTSPVEPA